MALLGAQAQTYYSEVQESTPRFRSFDFESLSISGADPIELAQK